MLNLVQIQFFWDILFKKLYDIDLPFHKNIFQKMSKISIENKKKGRGARSLENRGYRSKWASTIYEVSQKKSIKKY